MARVRGETTGWKTPKAFKCQCELTPSYTVCPSHTAAFGLVAASQGKAFTAKPSGSGMIEKKQQRGSRNYNGPKLRNVCRFRSAERQSIFGSAVASSSKVLGRAAEATCTFGLEMLLYDLLPRCLCSPFHVYLRL